MRLTISHNSALALLRAARSQAGKEGLSLVPCDLVSPRLDDGQRWTLRFTDEVKRMVGLPMRQPLHVLVGLASRRIHAQGIRNHVWGTTVPGLWFMELGDTGIAIPRPEVLLAQMAEVLSLPELIALGHELCGNYVLTGIGDNKHCLTGVPPVTSEKQVRDFFGKAKNLNGRMRLRAAIPKIHDGSLSPQETCLSVMTQLPMAGYGYQMGPIELNTVIIPGPTHQGIVKASCRTPDLLFRGTNVGINYDGDVHADLRAIVSAAEALGRGPVTPELLAAVREAQDRVRSQIASDKQRDRDLIMLGYQVLPVTKYDLGSIEGLDLVIRQAIHLIEETTNRDMSLQKNALDDWALREGRSKLLHTLRCL